MAPNEAYALTTEHLWMQIWLKGVNLRCGDYPELFGRVQFNHMSLWKWRIFPGYLREMRQKKGKKYGKWKGLNLLFLALKIQVSQPSNVDSRNCELQGKKFSPRHFRSKCVPAKNLVLAQEGPSWISNL